MVVKVDNSISGENMLTGNNKARDQISISGENISTENNKACEADRLVASLRVNSE